MFLLTAIATVLALLAAAGATTGAANSCRYVRHLSFEGGNMTCPDTAPVLTSLRTIAPEGVRQRARPSTNWTMICDCPEWSLPGTDNGTGMIFSEWVSYNTFTRLTGVSWIRCAATKQYLSGLAFVRNVAQGVYHWWGRCSNLSAVHMKREEGFCWMSSGESRLVQGSNGSLSVPGDNVVMDSVQIEYPDYGIGAFYHTRWSYRFCLVLDVECRNPFITNGYTDLSPPPADDEYLVGTTNQLSKSYNESLQIYCYQGYYMEGHNIASCQANGEWTHLPTCKACKSIRYCKVHSCSNGGSSRCLECKPYTSTGYQVALNRNGKKCRVVPYINRTRITFLFVYKPGETIRMDCPAYGIPAPDIVWSSHTLNRSVSDVINSSRLHFFPNGSLEISELMAGDEALYSCAAINSVGTDTVYILVINELAYKFYLTPAAPQINQTRIILFYEANEPALLHCIASGSPTPRILWYKLDNDRQYSVPEYGNLRIKKLSNGTLSFAPIRRHDWGRYACEAVNDFGHDVAMWLVCAGDSCGGTYSGGTEEPPPFLFVEYAPIIIHWKKVHIVSEGDFLSVSCIAGGNPPPLVEWRRGNNIVSENGTLILQQVSVHDTGIYSCVARSRAGMDTRDMALILDRRTKVDSVTTSRATLTHSITSLLTLLICLWAIAML